MGRRRTILWIPSMTPFKRISCSYVNLIPFVCSSLPNVTPTGGFQFFERIVAIIAVSSFDVDSTPPMTMAS